jgi:DNA-binding NarL/FixJ family response regulator
MNSRRAHPEWLALFCQRYALSPREQEILRFAYCDGLSDKEIASRIEVSPKTVHAYWCRAAAKVGAQSSRQVAAYLLKFLAEPSSIGAHGVDLPGGFRTI